MPRQFRIPLTRVSLNRPAFNFGNLKWKSTPNKSVFTAEMLNALKREDKEDNVFYFTIGAMTIVSLVCATYASTHR